MTRRDVINAAIECEKNGIFDRHIDPIPTELTLPVDENFRYPGMRAFPERFKYAVERFFAVYPFTFFENKFALKTKVVGRENLRGLKAAILTCNHVEKFDCLAIKYGARGHETYTVAAPFNNMRGTLGELMRAGNMLPMNTTIEGTHNFNLVVEDVLKRRKQFLVFYPEASMWWDYEKPRPYKCGAFTYAAKYNVPVVPQFITFRQGKKEIEPGIFRKHFTLHIMPPIYPDPTLGRKENAIRMKDYAYGCCKKVYEETYGVPLEYTCGDVSDI